MLLTLIDGRMCCLQWGQMMVSRAVTVRWHILQRVSLTAVVCENGQEGQRSNLEGEMAKRMFLFSFWLFSNVKLSFFQGEGIYFYVGILWVKKPFWLCIWLFLSVPHWPSNGIFLLKSRNTLFGNVYVPINRYESRFQWFSHRINEIVWIFF